MRVCEKRLGGVKNDRVCFAVGCGVFGVAMRYYIRALTEDVLAASDGDDDLRQFESGVVPQYLFRWSAYYRVDGESKKWTANFELAERWRDLSGAKQRADEVNVNAEVIAVQYANPKREVVYTSPKGVRS